MSTPLIDPFVDTCLLQTSSWAYNFTRMRSSCKYIDVPNETHVVRQCDIRRPFQSEEWHGLSSISFERLMTYDCEPYIVCPITKL